MIGKKNKISNIWILFVERLLSAFNWKLFAIVIATYPQHQLKAKLQLRSLLQQTINCDIHLNSMLYPLAFRFKKMDKKTAARYIQM